MVVPAWVDELTRSSSSVGPGPWLALRRPTACTTCVKTLSDCTLPACSHVACTRHIFDAYIQPTQATSADPRTMAPQPPSGGCTRAARQTNRTNRRRLPRLACGAVVGSRCVGANGASSRQSEIPQRVNHRRRALPVDRSRATVHERDCCCEQHGVSRPPPGHTCHRSSSCTACKEWSYRPACQFHSLRSREKVYSFHSSSSLILLPGGGLGAQAQAEVPGRKRPCLASRTTHTAAATGLITLHWCVWGASWRRRQAATNCVFDTHHSLVATLLRRTHTRTTKCPSSVPSINHACDDTVNT